VAVSLLLAVLALIASLPLGGWVFGVSIVLLGAVLLYDLVAKRWRVAGSVSMGTCRVLSLLLGAALCGAEGLLASPVLIAALAYLVYVGSVTAIASRETETIDLGFLPWLPLASLAVPWLLVTVHGRGAGLLSVVPLVLLSWLVASHAKHLRGCPEGALVSKTIGVFVGGLLLLQAVFCALMGDGGTFVALGLMLMWPIGRAVGRRFYSS
jgi:4-hydroxybenzoate polyprenyltransferase